MKNKRMKNTKTVKMNLTFSAADVKAALEAAWNQGWLCVLCMEKLTVQVEISPSDFCHECQAAVMSLIQYE